MDFVRIFLLIVLLGGTGCSRPKSALQTSSSPSADSCAFLTKEEIAAVQGVPPDRLQGSKRMQGGVLVTQCAISLPTAADSINLSVFQKVGEQSPAVLWNEMFHRKPKKKIDREGKEKEPIKPVKVDGVGDEAFWYGGQFGGMLHARKGDNFIQLSVGGPGDPGRKISQMRTLAEKVLARL